VWHSINEAGKHEQWNCTGFIIIIVIIIHYYYYYYYLLCQSSRTQIIKGTHIQYTRKAIHKKKAIKSIHHLHTMTKMVPKYSLTRYCDAEMRLSWRSTLHFSRVPMILSLQQSASAWRARLLLLNIFSQKMTLCWKTSSEAGKHKQWNCTGFTFPSVGIEYFTEGIFFTVY